MTTLIADRHTEPSFNYNFTSKNESKDVFVGKKIVKSGVLMLAIATGITSSGNSNLDLTQNLNSIPVIRNVKPEYSNNQNYNKVSFLGAYTGAVDVMKNENVYNEIQETFHYFTQPKSIIELDEIEIVNNISPLNTIPELTVIKDTLKYEAKPKQVFDI